MRKYEAEYGRFLSVDRLWEKYRILSSYQYALNNPLTLFDNNGEDVLIAFSGANLFSESKSAVAGEIVDELKSWARKQGMNDFSAKAIATDYFDSKSTWLSAMAFFQDNYTKGEKVVIYGYSKGGEYAMAFAEALGKMGIEVDLLVTVDAADGFRSDAINRIVSSNVKVNENYYQEDKGNIGSRGYPNIRVVVAS